MKKILGAIAGVLFIIGLTFVFPQNTVQAASSYAYDMTHTENPYYDGVQYINGEKQVRCTYVAWQEAKNRLGISLGSWGNAKNWYANAAGKFERGSTPRANSIYCSSYGTYGHVAYVTSVSGSTISIIEGGHTGVVYPNVYSGTRGEYSNWAWHDDYFQGFIYLNSTPPPPKPSSPWISVSRKSFPAGWANTFTFGANDAIGYWIGIDRDGTRIITENVSSGVSYTFNEPGNYSAYITAGNDSGTIDSEKVTFTVWQARNIGDAFTAAILNTATGAAVTADTDYNVVVKQYKGTDDQLWLFEREGEYKRYKITNVKTGRCLDDVGAGTADDTNIRVYPDNGADAQRWYLRINSSGYSLVPMCASHGSADMWGGVSTDGNNIAMWTCVEGNGNQIFTLQIVDSPAYTSSFNGHRYELYNTSVAWKEAFQFCEQKGGHLVTISSQEEQSFINTMISRAVNNRIWAGGTNSLADGKWQWVTNETFNYSNWAVGEPNNSGSEDCLMLYKSSGEWNDVADIFNDTSFRYSFICEYDDEIESSGINFEKSFVYNGHRYEIYSNSLDWVRAKQYCENKGGHLVTIASAEENNTILNNVKDLKHEAYWMGITDVEHESKWHWITDEEYSYENWSSKEPNNSAGIEDYGVFVSVNGLWNDLSSRSVLNTDIGFICEYETSHLHSLQMVKEKDATCTKDGNTEYWVCSSCGKCFGDKAAKHELSKDKTVVKAIGHDFVTNEQYCRNGCGTKNPNFYAPKKANPVKVKINKVTFKRSKLKKAKKFKIGAKGQGRITYTLDKKAKKAKIKVSKKGTVTVPKKCKKGTYKITVKATGNSKYKAGSKIVKIKVK